MKILFIHPNFPGQFKHIINEFARDKKNQVVFICKDQNAPVENVTKVVYKLDRQQSFETHRYVLALEKSVFQGQEVWRVCKKMRNEEGFIPDVIVAHPGWGDALFVKDIYPEVPLLNFLEFYYRYKGADVNFDERDLLPIDDAARIRVKNATNLFNIEACDWGITATHWQRHVHPRDSHYKISALHEGIDIEHIRPMNLKSDATITMPNGTVLKKGDEIITHMERNFEPYRGFVTFMKAAEILCKERPNAHILLVGQDGISYGRALPNGEKYRDWMLKQVKLDMNRVHFLGKLEYDIYLKWLQFSSVHVYLTVPFVLSWSMLESMAAGCALVASRTEPVMEAVEDGYNGLLCDFFDHEELAAKVIEMLENKQQTEQLRINARKTIAEKYDIKKILPLYKQLITDLADKKVPPPTATEILKMNPEPEFLKKRKMPNELVELEMD